MNANFAPELTQKLETLPERPGVYIYRSSDRTVIYVGKAVVLRNRVRSYFQANRDPKTRRLVSEIVDLEWIVTDTGILVRLFQLLGIKKPETFDFPCVDGDRSVYNLMDGPGIIQIVAEVRQFVRFVLVQVAQEFLFYFCDGAVNPLLEGVLNLNLSFHW